MKTAPSYTASGLQMLCVVFAKDKNHFQMSFTWLSISPAILPTIHTEENQFTQSTNKKTIVQREKTEFPCADTHYNCGAHEM